MDGQISRPFLFPRRTILFRPDPTGAAPYQVSPSRHELPHPAARTEVLQLLPSFDLTTAKARSCRFHFLFGTCLPSSFHEAKSGQMILTPLCKPNVAIRKVSGLATAPVCA